MELYLRALAFAESFAYTAKGSAQTALERNVSPEFALSLTTAGNWKDDNCFCVLLNQPLKGWLENENFTEWITHEHNQRQ